MFGLNHICVFFCFFLQEVIDLVTPEPELDDDDDDDADAVFPSIPQPVCKV